MSLLLGPPAIYSDPSASVTQPLAQVNSGDHPTPSSPVVPATGGGEEEKMDSAEPEMGLTENKSATYLSTGNPSLDFFFHILPDTPKDSLIERLELAWKHNPLTALKLICHLRGVRGTGKSDKRGFYIAALWLHENHPKTLALNVKWFAEFGYLKDLLEILYRLLQGFDVRETDKKERKACPVYWSKGKRKVRTVQVAIWKKGQKEMVERSVLKQRYPKRPKKSEKKSEENGDVKLDESMENLNVGAGEADAGGLGKAGEETKLEESNLGEGENKDADKKKEAGDDDDDEDDEDDEDESLDSGEEEEVKGEKEKKEPPKLPKKKNKIEMAKKAVERYNTDPNYRFLHDKISDLFAELLSSDTKYLQSKQYKKISLAAKWCPSLDSSYDQSTLVCESIAKRMFPRDSDSAYEGIEEAHYAYRVRDRLRKQVLSPLRQVLQLPEVYMSAKKWDSLPYERVASVAMKLYRRHFVEHDSERFTAHIENVKKGKAKMAAGALLPHEILDSLDEAGEEEEQVKDVAELQWKRMVEDLSVKGKLNNCLSVCDVSGSMSGLPMKVCVALGILTAELSEAPWKGKLITFSESPTLQILQGDTLKEKKSFVENMDWGMNTDFQKVFDLILGIAVNGKLNDSKMIKRLFVFSDMEFDQASANDWETDYQAILRKFNESGYGSAVPEIVFWNLRDSRSTPVAAKQKGVALVSGYSKNLLNLFLEGKGPLDPVFIMESAIAGAEYNNLKVYD